MLKIRLNHDYNPQELSGIGFSYQLRNTEPLQTKPQISLFLLISKIDSVFITYLSSNGKQGVGWKKLSLWQELEGLQKKKAEFEGQFNSFGEKAKTMEERMKVIQEGLGLQEERVRKLEVQLKDKHDAMNKLESKIAGLEKILKKPVKEPAKEEPVKELPKEIPETKTETITLTR
jgi:hypothetical protein